MYPENTYAEDLIQGEDEFRVFAEKVPFPVWISDARFDRVYFNPSWFAFTGRGADQEEGQGWLKGVHPEDATDLGKAMKRALDAGADYQAAFRLQDASGGYRHVQETAFPRYSPAGRFMGFIGASADRSLFDKTLRQFQQMKKEHEEMTHVLSHDLKAPLRAIEGFSEAILEDFGNQLNPEILEYLREISEGASRMRRLIEDLVTYARLGRDILTLNPLDSREVITEAISNLLEKVEACHATIDLIGNFPVVEGHRRALGLLFECLIDNSLKFRKEGCSPRITIEASSEGPFHLFTLTDNGIGIDAAFYEEVFGVFRRLHVASEFPGSGIGLALARKAAEIHEGRVDIRSSRDNGVTLEVRIPRRLDAAELT